jgi:aryl-alcohol dehydrogenase-like predicted oxidoreductase
MIKKNLLGSTGIKVSAIALGGHEYLSNGRSRGFNEDFSLAVTPGYLGEGYGGKRRKELLSKALELGVNFFDVTIDSEKEALGRNLSELSLPHEIYIQTRPEGMCYSYDKNNEKLLNPQLLKNEIQRILKLLKRDCIDFFNVGLLAWSIDSRDDYLNLLSENLSRLKKDGLIRFAVADSFSGERLYLKMLNSGAFDAVNIDLNFGDAFGVDKVLPLARQKKYGVIAREVFFKGELFSIGIKNGIDDFSCLARVAMKWLSTQGPNTVIVGVDNADQLIANLESTQQTMSDQEQEILEKLLLTPEFLSYSTTKRNEFYEAAK